MSLLSSVWLTGPMSALFVFAQIVSILRHRKYARLARENGLKEALTFLRSHVEALQEFHAFDAPASLKALLLVFSKSVSTELDATHFVERLVAASKDVNPDQQSSIMIDLEILRERRPGMAQVFDRVIASGLIAAALQWASVAETLNVYVSHLALDREKEVAVVVRAAYNNNDRGVGGFGRVPA